MLAVALGACLAVPQAQSAAAAPPLTVADAKAQIEQLEIDAAAIDQDYAAVKEELDSGRVKVGQKRADAKAQADKVERLKAQVGQVALAHYQNRQLDTAAQFFFSDDTEGFLSQVSTVAKVSENQNSVLQNYQQEQATLVTLRQEAETDVALLETKSTSSSPYATPPKRRSPSPSASFPSSPPSSNSSLPTRKNARSKKLPNRGRQQTGPTPSPTRYAAGSGRGAKALAFARTQIGKPYRFGATGPDAYDCSGLTGAAWRAAGVTLPRTSQQQFRVGKVVSQSDLQPGDIVFFYKDISHNGLYAGNGMLLDAPRPGKSVRYIKVSYMPFAGARRPG